MRTNTRNHRGTAAEVFAAFLRLGCTSFGGPVAHLGYFRAELVERRRWLDEASYADIVALCQFLPGPASSQTGITLGMVRAGLPGGFAAWAGFTLPSALALIGFAYGVAFLGDVNAAAWPRGLKIVAVAVVARAVWGMARSLCPDRERASLAIAATVLALAVPSTAGQVGAIALGAAVGWRWLSAPVDQHHVALEVTIHPGLGIAALIGFFGLLAALPLLAEATGDHTIRLFDGFYRSGALVFGGGHVVLPLLRQAVVPQGWVSDTAFLAGYGAAQAVPGPLFAFAAYLGTVLRPRPNGWAGGMLCLVAIYLPSFLLLIGVLPFWDGLRRRAGMRAALVGVNAAVVGLLLAALYDPVWTSAIHTRADFGIGVVAFLLLTFWRVAPWLVVVFGASVAAAVAALGVPV